MQVEPVDTVPLEHQPLMRESGCTDGKRLVAVASSLGVGTALALHGSRFHSSRLYLSLHLHRSVLMGVDGGGESSVPFQGGDGAMQPLDGQHCA